MEDRQLAAWKKMVMMSMTCHGRICMIREINDPDGSPEMKPIYLNLIQTAPVWAKATEN